MATMYTAKGNEGDQLNLPLSRQAKMSVTKKSIAESLQYTLSHDFVPSPGFRRSLISSLFFLIEKIETASTTIVSAV